MHAEMCVIIRDPSIRDICIHTLKTSKLSFIEMTEETIPPKKDKNQILLYCTLKLDHSAIDEISQINTTNPNIPIVCFIRECCEKESNLHISDCIDALVKLPIDPVFLNNTILHVINAHNTEIEIKQITEKTNQAHREFETFLKVGRTIASSLNLNHILTDIMNVTGKLLQSEAWSLALKDIETDELVFEAARGDLCEQVMGLRLPKGKGVIGWVAEHGEPLIVADTETDERHYKGVDKNIGFKSHSILCLPMKAKGKVLGAIEFINKVGTDQFTLDDIQQIKVFVDIAAVSIENALLYQRITHLSEHDELTGLFNQRTLVKILCRELEQAEKNNQPLAYLFLDLDHFKIVNDLFGHMIGRKTLTEIGHLLLEITDKKQILGRYGGDEFLFIVPGADREKAIALAEKIRSLIENHHFSFGRNIEFQLTASIGVAMYPEHAVTFDDLARTADKALLLAKQTDRNKVICK